MHSVGNYMVVRSESLPDEVDIPNFLNLLLQIVTNDSLHVSIPILHLWSQLLRLTSIKGSDPTASMLEPLLNLCIERLIKYEILPEDADIPALIFLREDLDTIPERHAFLGNYARFCKTIVENIVFKLPKDALQHVLSRTDQAIQEARSAQAHFDMEHYKKSSHYAIRLDAQVTVIEAALLGYTAWRADRYKRMNTVTYVPEQHAINGILEKYCRGLFDLRFEEPNIQQRIVVMVSDFTLDPLKRTVPLVLSTFQYLLDVKAALLENRKTSSNSQYNEDTKELQRLTSHQIQRLSLKFSDDLIDSFSEIESKISRVCQMSQIDEEDRDRCIAALLIIVQRTTKLSRDVQSQRLESYISQTMSKWTNPQFHEQMQSFDGFCRLLHIDGIEEYFSDRQAGKVEDWSTILLDDKGRAMKAQIDASQHVSFAKFCTVKLLTSEGNSLAYYLFLLLR